MRNRVEVLGQIRVHDIRISPMQQFIHLPYRILRTLPRPVAVSIRLQVRFPDRFQNQLRRRLRHPVPYSWDSQWPLPAARLVDHLPPHRLWFVRLIMQVLPEPVQPLLPPPRLDVLEALSIHPWRAIIGFSQTVCMQQNVLAIHLVVELVEAESRLVLRLSIQLDLQVPDFIRRCQAHRQSPLLSSFPSTPEARALPSPSITRLLRYLCPSPTPRWSAVLSDAVRRSRPRDHPGPPLLTQSYLLGMLCSLPRWSDPCCWLCFSALPRRVLPDRLSLPRFSAGSAPHWAFRGLLELYPRYVLRSHSPAYLWTSSRGSDPASFPTEPPASYRI